MDMIRQHGLFQGAGARFLDALEAAHLEKSCQKGQVLFLHEDVAERFYIIKSGWVKLYRETPDGAQAVIDICSTGQIIGETAVFEKGVYPYSAEVVENARIISLPLCTLKKELETNSILAMNMMSLMGERIHQQDKSLEHLALQNAPQRIGCFLLRLTSQKRSGKAVIDLPYDKMLVASRLGMQPETFSRALTKLRDATGMRIKGSTIELDDVQTLVNFSCTACSSGFPCKDL